MTSLLSLKNKYFLIICVLVFTHDKIFSQSFNSPTLGLSIGDSYYYKPIQEPGDFYIGLTYIKPLHKNYQFELMASYAIEGLNELWIQPKVNIVSHQYNLKPFFSFGAVAQLQPQANLGGSAGFGFIFPMEAISPFLSLRLSNQVTLMAGEPKDLIWEFFQLSALIKF